MARGKHARGNSSLVLPLSLGSLVIGIGLISWALTGIGAQSVPSADAYSPAFSPTTFTVEPVGLRRDSDVAEAPDTQTVLYPKRPRAGDAVGSLSIPALKQTWPIVEGTDEDNLKKGVGHFVQSVLPGEVDNSVLSGHRDTVFSGLGKLKVGDRVITKTSAGSFTYEIKRVRIVDKNDRTVIVPTDHAVLTLSTCYPFNYVGAAPKRYILVADLVAPQ